MKTLQHLFVPDWIRFIPGFLFCLLFAFLGMNLDNLIGQYYKADVASAAIPVLEKKFKEMKKRH